MSRYWLAPQVKCDLLEITDTISRTNWFAARRLLDKFTQSFRLIARHPGIGHRRVDLMGLRSGFGK